MRYKGLIRALLTFSITQIRILVSNCQIRKRFALQKLIVLVKSFFETVGLRNKLARCGIESRLISYYVNSIRSWFEQLMIAEIFIFGFFGAFFFVEALPRILWGCVL